MQLLEGNPTKNLFYGCHVGVSFISLRYDFKKSAYLKGGYTFVMLPRTVTPYRDSVDGTRDHVTYQKLVMR
jgi:hypothetical protein